MQLKTNNKPIFHNIIKWLCSLEYFLWGVLTYLHVWYACFKLHEDSYCKVKSFTSSPIICFETLFYCYFYFFSLKRSSGLSNSNIVHLCFIAHSQSFKTFVDFALNENLSPACFPSHSCQWAIALQPANSLCAKEVSLSSCTLPQPPSGFLCPLSEQQLEGRYGFMLYWGF